MKIDETTLNDIWDIVKEYIPDKKSKDAALRLLGFFDGCGVKSRDLESLIGEADKHLEDAINEFLHLDDEEDDEYLEEE